MKKRGLKLDYIVLVILAALLVCAMSFAKPARVKSKKSQQVSAKPALIEGVTPQFIDVNQGKILRFQSPKSSPDTPVVTPSTADTSMAIPPSKSSKKNQRDMDVLYDDNQQKGQLGNANYGEGVSSAERQNHKGPPSLVKGMGKNSTPKQFDRVWVMCIFVDRKVGNINPQIKEMVKMAARCNVNLAVHPFYVKGLSGSASKVKEYSRKRCNAVEGLGNYGIGRASVLNVTSNSNLPIQMCNASGVNPRDLAFCSEMASVDEGTKVRLANVGAYGGEAPPGQSAVSIVGPYGLSAAKMTGAALGPTMMNMTPGHSGGNGMALGDDGGWASGGAGPEEGWTDAGCARMRAMAMPNKIKWKWLPSQDKYIADPEDAGRLFDLQGKKNVFVATQGGGLIKDDPSKGGPHGGTTSGYAAGNFGDTSQNNLSPSQASVADAGGIGDGHKKKPGGSLGGAKTSPVPKEGVSSVRNRLVESVSGSSPGTGDGSSASSQGSNDRASSPQVAQPEGAGADGSSGAQKQVVYDDKVPAGGLAPLPDDVLAQGGAAGAKGAKGKTKGAEPLKSNLDEGFFKKLRLGQAAQEKESRRKPRRIPASTEVPAASPETPASVTTSDSPTVAEPEAEAAASNVRSVRNKKP